MVDIVKLFGKDRLDSMISGRFLNPMFCTNVPDGVYDNEFYKTRNIIYKGFEIMTCTHMWLSTGGPSDWDKSIKEPAFGTFPDPKRYVLEYGEDD